VGEGGKIPGDVKRTYCKKRVKQGECSKGVEEFRIENSNLGGSGARNHTWEEAHNARKGAGGNMTKKKEGRVTEKEERTSGEKWDDRMKIWECEGSKAC